MSEETKEQEENVENTDNKTTQDTEKETVEAVAEQTPEEKIAELNDKYLRLYSEFDNYRKRTSKERVELFKTAGQDILTDLLPVMDDFERALQNMDKKGDVKTIRKGVDLVFNKFKSTLENKGLKHFKSIEQEFDPEIHEAITKIPAPNKKLIGKVVDEVEKGYKLNEKVIRYAKVVVGQ
jgi:molecular chaperone GrpE